MGLSEAANRVIDLAHKVCAYYAAELPKRHPNYPLVGPDDESVPPPPEETELRDFLPTLSGELIYQLILLMYLGRGEFGADDLTDHYETVKGMTGTPGDAIAQMMLYKATLADELSDGLEELRKHKINVDKMLSKKAKVRKQ
jgi:hypothetical protein